MAVFAAVSARTPACPTAARSTAVVISVHTGAVLSRILAGWWKCEALREFRLNINSYSPEYGRSNGGTVMVSTKSGSNDFHGTLFEFLRNANFRELVGEVCRKAGCSKWAGPI